MSEKVSMLQLRTISRKFAEQIDFKPDLIVFIAKSGYVIADEFANYFGVELDMIEAHRAGGKLRKIVAPIFSLIPLGLRNMIVGAPVMYWLNGRKSNRNVKITESLKRKTEKGYKKILLVDDSIDTGWTFIHAYQSLQEIFPKAEIKTLALIQMKYAKERFNVDYFLYENELLLTPAQVDHEEHELFLQQYSEWKRQCQ